MIERIRFNTRPKQVYAPIFFSEYGPKFDRHGGISEDNGFWRIYSYGMISILNHDYRATTGFQLDLKGWGLEDLRFAETVLAAKYAFVRAYEPALYHPFHTKYCKGVVDEQYKGREIKLIKRNILQFLHYPIKIAYQPRWATWALFGN